MNLDDFKIQINKQLEKMPSYEMPVSGITNLHGVKTSSILEKIKSSLLFEIAFGAFFTFAFIYLAFSTDAESVKLYFSFFSVVLLVFIGILFFLFMKIKKANYTGLTIKQNLVSLHSLLSLFVKRCFQFTMLLIPVCFVSAIYLAYNDMQYHITNSKVYYDVPLPQKYIIILVIVILVFSIFVYFFTKWYLKKLYGNHLAELKQMVDEIDS